MIHINNFIESLKTLLPEFGNTTYLLAVSGGADSMVLAHLFLSANLKFEVAHINYHLRGEDSNKDQQVVERFCNLHEIPFHLYDVSDLDQKPENSIQNWAREIRYNFFRETLNKQKLDFIVMAHHLDDQLETFIMNLARASGINGLAGIPKDQNTILRPLLNFSKQDIYDFAKKENIEFREDISNQKNDYLRNKIRNQIVPKLLEINENFLQNFGKSMEILNHIKDLVNQNVEEKIQILSTQKNDTISFEKASLINLNSLIRFEIFKKFGFHDKEEQTKFFTSQTGSSFFSEDYEMLINRDDLIFRLKTNHISYAEKISLELDSEISNPVCLKIRESSEKNNDADWTFDKEKVTLPLFIRKSETGDYFQPSGMNGKKKISKFYKDLKLSKIDKENTRLLCDSNNNILGVIPYRKDARFEANENTKNFINISFDV